VYLLDTNHCAQLIKGHPSVVGKLKALGLHPIATCTIVEGELVYMAHRSECKEKNLAGVRRAMQGMMVFPVDGETARIYGGLKASIFDKFGPREKRQRRQFDFSKLGISDNDLWIASVARRNNLVVVTADEKDFRRIEEAAPGFIKREKWYEPSPE
jgi:tRNA(fMet)-specific endonuclease VapC